jgi:hypothetical protein
MESSLISEFNYYTMSPFVNRFFFSKSCVIRFILNKSKRVYTTMNRPATKAYMPYNSDLFNNLATHHCLQELSMS